MGQYHMFYNLDKKEFIDPYKFDTGLKLWEQLNSHYLSALHLLLCACPHARGGGDYHTGDPALDQYIGRWAGDRIVLVGDYAEETDHPEIPENLQNLYYNEDYTNISDDILPLVERVLDGTFNGIGWLSFTPNQPN